MMNTLCYKNCIDIKTGMERIVIEIYILPSQKPKVVLVNFEKQTKSRTEGYTCYLCFKKDKRENNGVRNILKYSNSYCG